MPLPIEIIILGSGSAIPSLERKHPAILLKYEGDYMLFDCGECAQLGLQKAGISPMKIKRIFITHWHADHFAGIIPLIETLHMLGRKKMLEIYAPEAERFVETILELSYWSFGFKIKPVDVSLENEQKIVKEKKYEIFSLPVVHSVPAVGYIFQEKDHWKIIPSKIKKLGIPQNKIQLLKEKGKIKINGKTVEISEVARKIEGRRIVYSGDTLPVEKIFEKASNSVLIHDATFVEPVEGRAHSSFEEVCELAKKYKVKKLILTHISKRYKNHSELVKKAKKYFSKAIVAKDGMKIIL